MAKPRKSNNDNNVGNVILMIFLFPLYILLEILKSASLNNKKSRSPFRPTRRRRKL